MSNVIERMRRGDLITYDDPDYPALWMEFEKTRALVAELNGKYHTPEEITSLLSEIWGQELVEVRMFPPFYTAFGNLFKLTYSRSNRTAKRSKTAYNGIGKNVRFKNIAKRKYRMNCMCFKCFRI